MRDNIVIINPELQGTLRIALEIAAERFAGYGKDGVFPQPIRVQFANQADQCRQMIELIDNA